MRAKSPSRPVRVVCAVDCGHGLPCEVIHPVGSVCEHVATDWDDWAVHAWRDDPIGCDIQRMRL